MTTFPFEDTTDFDDADRGLIGSLEPCVVTADDGRVVWDNDAYAFLDARLPGHRQPEPVAPGQLCAKQGLYEVTDGIYQVRGLDLSNMTLVEGDDGRDRDRSAHLQGDARPPRSALYRDAPRRPAGDGGDLHARPRRPLRRRARRVTDDGIPIVAAARLHGSGGRRERVRRHGHEPAGRVHVRRQLDQGPARPDRRRPRADHLDRHDRPASRRRSRSRTPARRRRSTASASGSR